MILTKTFRVMQLTAMILLVCSLHVLATGNAQGISLSVKDESLQTVFAEIRKQADVQFLFVNELMDKAKRVSIQVKNATLKEVLDLCFKDQSLSYTIKDNVVLIKQLVKHTPTIAAAIPPKTIAGRIFNEKGDPVIATILIKGTNRGASSDAYGYYFIDNVPDDAVFVVSSVGYQTQSIVVNGRFEINIVLKFSQNKLDEVQIIAYGTTSKRLATGNVGSITAEEIQKQPVNNPLLTLQGRVPGIQITQNSGVPGGGITVRIQGQNSIESGNDPLYVVDGVPLNSQLPSTLLDNVLGSSGNTPVGAPQGAGNALSYLNASDIERIDILKDADATAIYGSRAANGAILITTKKGMAGKTGLEVNLQRGWGKITRRLDVLNRRQYLDMRYEAYANDGIDWRQTAITANDLKLWDTFSQTDWQNDLIGGTADYLNVNAAVSGGTTAARFYLGTTYNSQTTVFPLPKDFKNERGAVHFNFNSASPNNKANIQFSANYLIDNNKLPSSDLTTSAVQIEPVAPELFLEDGSLNWALNSGGVATFINPLSYMYATYENKTTNLVTNLLASYKIIEGLKLSVSLGYNDSRTDDYSPVPLSSIRPNWRNTTQANSASYGNRTISSWIIEPQINYDKNINKGKFQILIGSTLLNNKSEGGYSWGYGYSSDNLLKNISAASQTGIGYSFFTNYKYNAAFGRISYNWNNRYLLNVTGRRDGSSRFGDQNLFHNFGAIGAGWIFTNEPAITSNNPTLSFGKIRASYGTTGNDQIADYRYFGLYQPLYYAEVPYQNANSLTPAGLPNPELQWEKTEKLQAGLDLGFLRDRILVGLTLTRNTSSNQLLPYVLPLSTGFGNIDAINFPATIVNQSLEFSFSSTNFRGQHFSWTTNFNLTFQKNELTDFPDLENSSYAQILAVGQPINVERLFRFEGVDTQTGLYRFTSKTDPLNPIFQEDATSFITTAPSYYGGFQNALSFDGLELDFLFQFMKQRGENTFYSNGSSIYPGQFFRGASNQPVSITDRWTAPGDVARTSKLTTISGGTSYQNINNVLLSDAAFTDASFIRLKNISLSWRFPLKWLAKIKASDLRIFAQAQNVLTLTKYEGLDPENTTVNALPPLKVVTVGVKIQI